MAQWPGHRSPILSLQPIWFIRQLPLVQSAQADRVFFCFLAHGPLEGRRCASNHPARIALRATASRKSPRQMRCSLSDFAINR